MSDDVNFSGHESEESESAEVFLNRFSDSDDEEESVHEHAIFAVRNSNVITPSFKHENTPTKTRPNFTSFKENFDHKADDKHVPSDTRVDDYRDHLLSYSSSETSCTDSDDDYTSSDDEYAEIWAVCQKPLRPHRNKNVIPIGNDPTIAKHHKHAFSPEQVKDFPTKTKIFSSYNQTTQRLSRNENKTGPQLFTGSAKSKSQSYFNTDFSMHSKENSGFVKDEDQPPTPRCRVNYSGASETMNDVDETRVSQSNFSGLSSRSLKSEDSEVSSSAMNATVEKLKGHKGTGSVFGRNAKGMHQFEVQSNSLSNSVFCSWNENWTTDDYLICPNFLLGAPNVEDHDDIKEAGHTSHYQTYRIPRMFHRRVNKDGKVDASRDDPFVASSMNNPLTELFKIVKEMRIDVTKFLEQADKLGLPMQFPCMQCHESSTMTEVATEFLSGSAQYPPDGRCHRCGGQLQTLASLGKMVARLRDTVAKNNFEIRDVYPDGNCMFGTVIDQLRVRGDFRYTVHTLRTAVVDYLRDNPKAEDGTPLEMFLTNETWDEYLKRMSEDGQWGDHMVLNALTNVLQMRILIFGGRNGETETVLTPNIPEQESTEASSGDVKGTDIATIYMGHLGETHYVSFRPENWWQVIQEKNFKTQLEWEHRKFDPLQSIYVPVRHLDFILSHTIKLKHISNCLSALADIPQDDQGSEFTVIFVGPIMCKMVPDYTSQVESMAPDISIFFPDTIYKAPSNTCVLSVFQIPRDTCIQRHVTGNNRLNLLTEPSSSDLSHVRLLPVTASLWEGQTIKSSTGPVYLKVIDLESIPFEKLLQAFADKPLTMHRTLAFKSDWPEVADEWISRQRKSGKPEELLIQSVASVGCHVVPIISNENQNNVIDSFVTADIIDDQDMWSYSFAVAETKLSSCISDSQRCCYLLLKSLLDFTCSNPVVPAALPKSVFFYACENIEEDEWCLMPARCLIIMLEKLVLGLTMNFSPHYFISAQNLLQNIPPDHIEIWIKNIEGILKQPVVSLYYVLDMLDITSSEIGAVFDDIIEDLPRFNSHKSIERSFNETFVPATGTLIENLIYQAEYDFAMITFEGIYEQICRFTNRPIDAANVMRTVLQSVVLGYKWCFGLYIDLMRGTTLTKDIGNFCHDVVHITEVFGPDIDDETISNTVVPAVYSITSGDLKFPSVCAEVMLKAGRKTLLAKCLRYYIDTYSEIAGDNIVIGTCSQYKLKSLQGIYMTLLETYDELGCVSEFRTLMDNLTMITQIRQTHAGFHDLAKAWEILGEPELAVETCPCYSEHKGGFMKSVVRKLFKGMRGFD